MVISDVLRVPISALPPIPDVLLSRSKGAGDLTYANGAMMVWLSGSPVLGHQRRASLGHHPRSVPFPQASGDRGRAFRRQGQQNHAGRARRAQRAGSYGAPFCSGLEILALLSRGHYERLGHVRPVQEAFKRRFRASGGEPRHRHLRIGIHRTHSPSPAMDYRRP